MDTVFGPREGVDLLASCTPASALKTEIKHKQVELRNAYKPKYIFLWIYITIERRHSTTLTCIPMEKMVKNENLLHKDYEKKQSKN
jgi:hypothetical protein